MEHGFRRPYYDCSLIEIAADVRSVVVVGSQGSGAKTQGVVCMRIRFNPCRLIQPLIRRVSALYLNPSCDSGVRSFVRSCVEFNLRLTPRDRNRSTRTATTAAASNRHRRAGGWTDWAVLRPKRRSLLTPVASEDSSSDRCFRHIGRHGSHSAKPHAARRRTAWLKEPLQCLSMHLQTI